MADTPFDVVEIDFTDQRSLCDALEGVQRVFWCGGGPLPAESEADVIGAIEQRVGTLDAALGAMSSLAVPPEIVLFSSGGTVYGGSVDGSKSESMVPWPTTAYGMASLCTELFVSRYGARNSTNSLILRCGNVYGSTQPSGRSQGLIANVIDAARSGRSLSVFGDGRAARDYVHLDDVVDVALQLSTLLGVPSVVNIGTGVGSSILEVVEVVSRELGVEIPLEFHEQRGSDLTSAVLDIALLGSLLDVQMLSLTEGIRRTLADPKRSADAG